MVPAIGAAILTLVYLGLALADPGLAESAAIFYVAALVVLLGVQHLTRRRHGPRA
jgi:hypothetical protein